jgi:hypothetical protein
MPAAWSPPPSPRPIPAGEAAKAIACALAIKTLRREATAAGRSSGVAGSRDRTYSCFSAVDPVMPD